MKIIQGIFIGILALILSFAAHLTASAFRWSQELPDLSELDAYEYSSISQVFARDGELIGEILPLGQDGALTDRIPVRLDEVSPAVISAIIAYEDSDFFDHYGFDISGLMAAVYELALGDGGRGGSTITTQVIKNSLLTDIASDRSLERKAKELMLAVKLERRLTKAEILQRYINLAYWGSNLYGIRQAARAYFDRDPSELNLAQGLYLARLLPSPNSHHDNFEATRRSMRVVLNSMVSQGVISEEVAERAWLHPLEPTGWEVEYDEEGNIVDEPQRTGERLRQPRTVTSDLAPHVTLAIRNAMQERYGRDALFGTGGLRVYTTIDVQAQQAANQASLNAEVPPGAQLGVVGIDPETGEVLAMVGAKLTEGQSVGEFNRVTSANRQPGSSFKPIVYATAIEDGGYTQADVITDEQTSFPQADEAPYTPRNHDHHFVGRRTLREHLNISRNIPVVKLAEAVTPNLVASRARSLGYQVEPYLSISLGAFETTPLNHASAIGAFANGGVHVEPHLIQRIEDAEGHVLWEVTPRETRVWSEETAYVLLDMLHGNVSDGTGFSHRARIDGRWVAGKTGTTNDERDIWFVGMTPGMVAAAWIGYDDNRPIPGQMDPSLTREGDGTVNSSRQPIYLWRDFVAEALRGTPTGLTYDVPEGIEVRQVDRSSGSASDSGTAMAFASGAGPRERLEEDADPIQVKIPIDTSTNARADEDTPRENLAWVEVDSEEIEAYLSSEEE